MSYNCDFERICKQQGRLVAWDSVKGVAKKVLLLPSKYCIDIDLGLGLGKVNKDTEFVLFERDYAIAQDIHKYCQEKGLKYTLYNMDLLDFTGDLLDFDLCFFDFCGEVTQKMFDFFKKVRLQANCLAFTFSTIMRHNSLFKKEGIDCIRKSFKVPGNAQGLKTSKNGGKHAEWSCDTILYALGQNNNPVYPFLKSYSEYNDTGVPMVFFSTKPIDLSYRKGFVSNPEIVPVVQNNLSFGMASNRIDEITIALNRIYPRICQYREKGDLEIANKLEAEKESLRIERKELKACFRIQQSH